MNALHHQDGTKPAIKLQSIDNSYVNSFLIELQEKGAAGLAAKLTESGLSIGALSNGKSLTIAPVGLIDDDIRAALKAGKAALLAWLNTPAANDAKPQNEEKRVGTQCPPSKTTAELSEISGVHGDGCWPHGVAWNTAEVTLYLKRLDHLHNQGIRHQQAEALAQTLLERDRTGDERRLCLECDHHHHNGRCVNAVAAGLTLDRKPFADVKHLHLTLQRCKGFRPDGCSGCK
jgi:hypothetical protein